MGLNNEFEVSPFNTFSLSATIPSKTPNVVVCDSPDLLSGSDGSSTLQQAFLLLASSFAQQTRFRLPQTAKATMMTRPYTLLRHALPSSASLIHLPKRHLVSASASFTGKNEVSFSLWSCAGATNKAKLRVDSHGYKLSKLDFGHVGLRKFTTGATHVNGAGSIDSPLMQSMENKIKEELNADSVIVKDAYGDGRHVSIDVISSAFEGQSAVNRQRMVYKAIWEDLQTTVHAVDQMTTKTPTEAAAQK